MRTFCAFVVFFFCILYFSSCQKQLTDSTLFPEQKPGDSITLVKTMLEVDYDSSGAFLYKEWQSFVYDSVLNRTVVSIADSDIYSPVRQYTATFQYDASKRLSEYTSTGGYEPAAKIDFFYNGTGDIIKSTITDNWVGKTFDCWYTTTRQAGQKTITVYDTSGAYITPFSGDTRPEISIHIFDAEDKLIKQSLLYTYYHERKNYYEDTMTDNLHYNSQDVLYMSTSRDSYHNSPDVIETDVSLDSTVFAGEGNVSAIRNSYLYVYRNMYWLTISEFGTGFANALNNNFYATATGLALKNKEFWRFYGPSATPDEHEQGSFQNVFDADGQLIKAVTPKNFGNKYGGRTEYYYTYTKLKK